LVQQRVDFGHLRDDVGVGDSGSLRHDPFSQLFDVRVLDKVEVGFQDGFALSRQEHG